MVCCRKCMTVHTFWHLNVKKPKRNQDFRRKIDEFLKEVDGGLTDIGEFLKEFDGLLAKIDEFLKEFHGWLIEIDEFLKEFHGLLSKRYDRTSILAPKRQKPKRNQDFLNKIDEFLKEFDGWLRLSLGSLSLGSLRPQACPRFS